MKNCNRLACALLFFILLSATDRVDSKTVGLYYTSNTLGEIASVGCLQGKVGGLDRRATLLSQIDFVKQPNFLFDTGDLFFKTKRLEPFIRDQLLSEAKLITDFYGRFKPDAMIFGELDLAQGIGFLKKEGREKFPYLSINLFDSRTQKALFRTHRLLEKGGVRVAVIGLLSEGLYRGIQEALPNVVWKPSQGRLNKLVRKLKPKVDLVVILSHALPAEEKALFSSLSDFVVVLSGHSGEALAEPRQIGKRALIFQADARGQYVGKIKLSFSDLNKPFVNMGSVADLEGKLAFLEEERRLLSGTQGRKASALDPMVRELNKKIELVKKELKGFSKSAPNRYWSELVPLEDGIASDPEMRVRIEKLQGTK